MGQPGMPFGVPPQQQPVMQAGGFAPGPQGAPGMWGAPAAVPQAQPQFGGVGLPPLDPAQQGAALLRCPFTVPAPPVSRGSCARFSPP